MNRLTKIVATISDKTATEDSLNAMLLAGVDAIRLNTAHMNIEEGKKIISLIRKVSQTIPIMIDTKGPEVRTTFCDNPISLTQNEIIEIQSDPTSNSNNKIISVSYENFHNEVPVGSEILIDDGEVSLTVISANKNRLQCKVNNCATIGSRKSVNVPSVSINVPSLSTKDIEFIHFAADYEVDFIAHSFVRTVDDVRGIQNLLDQKMSSCKIIAKIENQEGIDNIDDILDHVYGIIVARGDLGIEIPIAHVPQIQKILTHKAIEKRRAVIVATQMLHSMIEHPRPTRAEVSDVANAIYDGADAVMLSGETAYGKYPLEAIRAMADIATEAAKVLPKMKNISREVVVSPIASHLTKSAIIASADLDADAIIADSKSGRTIRALAAYRSSKPIFAFCYDSATIKQINLFHGVIPIFTPPRDSADKFIEEAISHLVNTKKISEDSIVVILAGNFGTDSGASFIEICEAKRRIKK